MNAHQSLYSILFLLSLSLSHQSVLRLPSDHRKSLGPARGRGEDDSLYCDSWRFSVETNDAGKWSTVPSRCADYVRDYVTGERYVSDSSVAADNALEFARAVGASSDGRDAWVFDIDETLLSNLPYYEEHGFG
ncbi:hypothetical protein MLD38_005690 [Melastoma candidum]|nr:hypothetical protein MLD38_005690 [Melastoma candidum]